MSRVVQDHTATGTDLSPLWHHYSSA